MCQYDLFPFHSRHAQPLFYAVILFSASFLFFSFVSIKKNSIPLSFVLSSLHHELKFKTERSNNFLAAKCIARRPKMIGNFSCVYTNRRCFPSNLFRNAGFSIDEIHNMRIVEQHSIIALAERPPSKNNVNIFNLSVCVHTNFLFI